MQNSLRDKLESAALRLDDFLSSPVVEGLDRHEHILLAAAADIAQAIEMLDTGA
jgi:hypothetical protein